MDDDSSDSVARCPLTDEQIQLLHEPITDTVTEMLNSLEISDESRRTLPDSVVLYLAACSGFDTNSADLDPMVLRLIGVAAEKFIADIVSDTKQRCRLQAHSKDDGDDALRTEMLKEVLSEYGIE